MDSVVGNPPYIRYHGFQGDARASAAVAVAHHGIRLTDLTSSWAPFVVHATSFLRPRGRLAFVLPGELLYVDYAKAVRDFLSVAYSSVSIIAFNERVFPGVLADTLLVLAEKQGPMSGLSVVRLRNLAELPEEGTPLGLTARVPFNKDDAKWSHLMLPSDARLAYHSLTGLEGVSRLGKHFCVDIGVVSGNNDFFLLTQDQLKQSDIPRTDVTPCLSSSRHLLGTRIGERELAEIQQSGQRSWLLNLAGKPRLSAATKAYLSKGDRAGATEGYKTHSRRRWYEVPSVYAPDAFMSYFISEAPRFTTNDVGATSTNTIHRMRRVPESDTETSTSVLSCYSTLTRLSAEVEGRSYGGGVAKLETKEAENLLIVVPNEGSKRELSKIEARIHSLLREHHTTKAAEVVDEILLEGQLGLTARGVRLLKEGLESLRSRREARMRTRTAGNS
ncbi:MAG: Eco57I restriction-modification methylase domain-containing protein [Thermoplasmata archaeon]